jgi:class 3 adenylate cyclase/tetratricopeptide (TPR) repeat protein
MICPRCQHDNQADAIFCEECGGRVEAGCPSCGAANQPAAKFCRKCGQRLGQPDAAPPVPAARYASPESYTPKHLAERILTSKAALEGERKQVTVLFADLKGSMELLADRDPEEARKLLDPVLEHMMEAVHRFEGTVNQVMGDGIMALFGAPLAHEDHAVRACYAALRMQESLRRYAEDTRRSHGVEMQIRVGLNSGAVVVRSVGSDLHMDYTAVGQTTHLAARMEQLAPPGTVRLTGETLRLAEGYVEVRALGPIPVKGLPEPIEVYELTGAGVARTRLQAAVLRGLTRFVGREDEIEHLRRVLGQAAAGHGQVVAIVGEAGVGKSRLVYEFTHSHRVQDWLILDASSVSYGRATSYLPVIELLKGYFKIGDRDDHREMRAKVLGRVLGLDRGLEPLLPPLLALLDVPVEEAGWQNLDPPQRRQRTLDAVRRLLLRESQVQPLLVVFEDLHWVDGETQALLDSLVESLASARLLLLVNYRPGYEHRWGSKTAYSQLRLDSLPAESAAELLAALLGPDPGLAPLMQMLVKRGNPFFLEETVRTLVETGALVGERGAYRLMRPVEALQVPATVQTILAARIDRLPAEEKQLLQAAAVIGKHVPHALLAAIAEQPEEGLRQGLGHLQEGEFLYETQLFPDLEYTFKHALTHEVTYGGLLQDRRRQLHRRIVAATEGLYPDRLSEHVELLAHHAFRGELWDKAPMYLRQAGAKALARSANREAVAYFEQALAALSHLPETRATIEQGIDLRFDLRASLFALMDLQKALGYVRQAEQLAQGIGDQRRLASALVYTSHHFLVAGDAKDAHAFSRNAHDIAVSLGDVPLLVAANLYYGATCIPLADFREAREYLEKTLHLLRGASRRERFGLPGFPAAVVGHYLPWALAELGEFDVAIARATEGIQVAETVDHAYSIAVAQWGLAFAYVQRGDIDPAIRLLERATTFCREWTVPILLQISTGLLGIALARAGRVAEGIAALRDARRAVEEAMGPGHYNTLNHLWLGEALARARQHDDAREAASHALGLTRQFNHWTYEGWALRLLGEIALESDPAQPVTAEERLRQALALGEKRGMRPLVARTEADLARLCRRTGRWPEADEHWRTASALYREMGMTYWLARDEAELGAR